MKATTSFGKFQLGVLFLAVAFIANTATISFAQSVPVPDGIVSWWRAEDDASDTIGSNHGSLMGGAGFGPGKVGRGFLLDGTNDWVAIPDAGSLDLTNEITIEMWFKSDAWVAGATHALLDKRTTSDCNYGAGVSRDWGLQLYYNDPTVFGGDHPGNQFEIAAHFPLPSLGVFHHFAGTYKQADAAHIELKTYLDGALIETRLFSGNLARTVNGMMLTIGASRGGTGEFFRGVIDEITLYNRALGSNEIAAIYAADSTGKSVPPELPAPCDLPAGIVSWWRAESNGLDSLGSNHGTLMGGTSYAPGKVGQSFNFDGASRVQIPDADSLDFPNTMTVEAWVNLRTYSGINSREIVSKFGGPYMNEASFTFAIDPSTKKAYYIVASSNGASGIVYSSAIIPTNRWVHLAGVYDGAAVRMYVNGQLDGSTPWSQPPRVGRNPVVIGCTLQNYSQPTSFFNGLIDEVSLYNRALTSNEIAAIHAADSTGKCLPPAELPVITQQPTGTDAVVGDTATFSVTATGTAPLTYQWQWNDAPIAGATASVLTLTDVQLTNAGSYSVIVSNAAGSVPSSSAALNVTLPHCTPAPDGLVAWWRAEENVLDDFGQANGQLLGAAGFGQGKVGQAFRVNGSVGSLVRIPNAPSLNVTNYLTFEAWVKVSAYPAVDALVAGKDAPSGGRQYMLGLANVGGKWILRAHVGLTSGFQVMNGNTAVSTNTWVHALMTYDGAQFRLYVNGQLDASMPATGAIVTSASPLWIGGFGTGPWNFNGMVDELSVYNRALTTNEIAAIYAARGEGKCPLPPIILAVTPPGTFVNEGANVSFAATATGSPPLTYQWQFNGDDIAGATASSLSLSNVVFAQAGNYTLTVTGPGGITSSNVVLAINRAPVADASATKSLVVSPNGSNAVVALDGSLSTDPDADALTFAWYLTGSSNAFATGCVASATLPLGANQLTLAVHDGLASTGQDFTVEVITFACAFDELRDLVRSGDLGRKAIPLLAALRTAEFAQEHDHAKRAIMRLNAFKFWVRKLVQPDHPDLAAQLLQQAQAIIAALGGNATPTPHVVRIESIAPGANGKVHLRISGESGRVLIVEATSNMNDWTPLGEATETGPNTFEFDDDATSPGLRYYRVVAPE